MACDNLMVSNPGLPKGLFLDCVPSGCASLVVTIPLVFERVPNTAFRIHKCEVHSLGIDGGVSAAVR